MVLPSGKTNVETDYRLFFVRKNCSEILPFLAREIGSYTDHGTEHSKRIEDLIDKICELVEIDPFSVYLLRASAWLHDTGYIYGEKQHHQNTSSLIEKHANSLGLQRDDKEDLRWICLAHEKDFDIKHVPEKDGNIQLRYLAALFRMLDSCDVNCSRAPEIVFRIIRSKMPHKSIEHWKSNQAVRHVIFDQGRKAIVVSIEDESRARIAFDLIKSKIESVRDELKDKFPCIDVIPEVFPTAP
jgi:exopolyphosphatase/pppGpp-phosphohydrolase